jgi:hypothetical protein
VLLVTRNSLDEDQLSGQVQQADALGLQSMYVPIYFELPLKDLVKGQAGIYDFARNGDFNLVPTTDDQPYFYQIKWGLPEAVTLLLVLSGIAVLIYLVVTASVYRKSGRMRVGALAGYFAILGAAYMLVLVPLVQRFYLLMSNEAVRIPPELASEMTAYDPTAGELRTHYAGFFDPGFGYDREDAFRGSRAALEVRAHDVPFMVEHGQPVCKLTFERMLEPPTRLYGEGIGSNYQRQEETLGKHFIRPTR